MSERYPNFLTWKLSLVHVSGLEDVIRRQQALRVRKAGAILNEANYRFVVQVVDQAFLGRFIPIYIRHISAKAHGEIFDVRTTLEANQQKGFLYEVISLWRHEHLLGGLIYNVHADRLSVAYRVFPYQLPERLPISCGYVAEQYLLERALALGKDWIVHGKDHNPYGPYSTIGLARYKLSVGYCPFVSRAPELTFGLVDELCLTEDALVFLGDAPDERITRALLFMQPATPATQYQALFRYPSVQVVSHAPRVLA